MVSGTRDNPPPSYPGRGNQPFTMGLQTRLGGRVNAGGAQDTDGLGIYTTKVMALV